MSDFFCNPMDYNAPGSSVRGIFQARVLEQGAIAFSEERLSWTNNTKKKGKFSPSQRLLVFPVGGFSSQWGGIVSYIKTPLYGTYSLLAQLQLSQLHVALSNTAFNHLQLFFFLSVSHPFVFMIFQAREPLWCCYRYIYMEQVNQEVNT